MASYTELISIGTLSLIHAPKAEVTSPDASPIKTTSIRRNYPNKGKARGSSGLFDRARSMFFRSTISELSIR